MPLFSELPLIRPLLNAVEKEGYSEPTPIQAEAIPHLVEGKDLLGVAQTGTGKTAAFTLPILNRVAQYKGRPKPKTARVLILAPTRELASQINDSIRAYGTFLRLRRAVVFGGAPIVPQIKILKGGVDTLVATPGRLMDLMNQGHVDLSEVSMFVLDEADRMLDMGFVHDVRAISEAITAEHQTVLFSATMPKTVQRFANELLNDPVRVEVAPESTTAERVTQRVLYVPKDKKRSLLLDILKQNEIGRGLIFTRTKHGADWLVTHLEKAGLSAAAIHGDKRQFERRRALNDFKNGKINLLIATDIAARGIDVEGVTHVFNFELPMDPESYVHRIGRTARGGAHGEAVSFCDPDEVQTLRQIERNIRQEVPVDDSHDYHIDLAGKGFRSNGKKKFGGRGRGKFNGRNSNGNGFKGKRDFRKGGPRRQDRNNPANQSGGNNPKKEAA